MAFVDQLLAAKAASGKTFDDIAAGEMGADSARVGGSPHCVITLQLFCCRQSGASRSCPPTLHQSDIHTSPTLPHPRSWACAECGWTNAYTAQLFFNQAWLLFSRLMPAAPACCGRVDPPYC